MEIDTAQSRPAPAIRSLQRTPNHLEPPIPAPWTSATIRPLSDIRELSEPSLTSQATRSAGPRTFRPSNGASTASPRTFPARPFDVPSPVENQNIRPNRPSQRGVDNASSSYSSTPEQASIYSIPQASVPRRTSSSANLHRPSTSHAVRISASAQQASCAVTAGRPRLSIANRGYSHSPVKETKLRLDAHSSAEARRAPSQTLIRYPHPIDIIQYPTYRHLRVRLELQLSAPLFVGGGSVEGQVTIIVDSNERVKHQGALDIGMMAIDLLGFEDVTHGRTSTFLALGTELLDAAHPPPADMVQSADVISTEGGFWPLASTTTTLPFMVSLPLDTGPPPFQSKHARIRFLLTATALIRDAGKHYRIRNSQDIQVLSTYDPEKALTPLPSPLTATDEFIVARPHGLESVRVTAGIHRQVWVSGGSIFVDVHISNKTRKPIEKLELTLERNILCYKHAAAATLQKSAVQARIFESNKRSILARTLFKPGTVAWNGVHAHASDVRTCELELPRGHATVRCGKYFEVRYFLNVIVTISISKAVTVQLPIVLIHMVSLDVVPNSVAQVAAAIEEKRLRSKRFRAQSKNGHHPSRRRSTSTPAQTSRRFYTPGRAFAAPREQSRDRQKQHRADLENLQQIIDESPRRHQSTVLPPHKGFDIRKLSSKPALHSSSPEQKTPSQTLSVFGAISYRTPPRLNDLKFSWKPGRKKSDLSSPISVKGYHLREQPPDPQSLPHTSSTIRQATDVVSPAFPRPALSQSPEFSPADPSLRRHASPGSFASSSAALPRHLLAPHALGLRSDGDISISNRLVEFDGRPKAPSDESVSTSSPPGRPGTAQSFRDRFERGREELRAAVARKTSGRSLKEPGVGWWDGLGTKKSPAKLAEELRQVDERERVELERAGWI